MKGVGMILIRRSRDVEEMEQVIGNGDHIQPNPKGREKEEVL